WTREQGIETEDGDVNLVVDVSDDIEEAIEARADEATLLLMGATEEGLLQRIVTGSLVLDVANDVECSVVLAEKKREKSLLEKIFG
ncbi:MAG: amino acid transporter, partial [Halobacteria archaeon]|nr:amino acid transporter [Halobacteria archaeon]